MPVRDGPMPRIITFFGAFPVMMKPPIETSSPVCTFRRVERFSSCAGPGTVILGWLAKFAAHRNRGICDHLIKKRICGVPESIAQ